MDYKFKSTNGNVSFLLRTGKDFVKNIMPVSAAQSIVTKGTIKDSEVRNYPINVDNKWYFEGELISQKPKRLKKIYN